MVKTNSEGTTRICMMCMDDMQTNDEICPKCSNSLMVEPEPEELKPRNFQEEAIGKRLSNP